MSSDTKEGPPSTQVFLSYKRDDRVRAREIAELLEKQGTSVWWDAELQAGTDFRAEIENQLKRSSSVVALVSPQYLSSNLVEREIEFAKAQNKKIVPVFLSQEKVSASRSALAQSIASLQSFEWNETPEGTVKLGEFFRSTFEQETGKDPDEVDQEFSLERNRGYAFVSYAEEDFDFVDRLKTFLTEEGFLFWEFLSGDRQIDLLLYKELESKINDSMIVLSVISDAWSSSIWCAKEYFYSKEVGKPVFLVEHQAIGPNLALAGEHRIRCHGENVDQGFRLLSRELTRRGL